MVGYPQARFWFRFHIKIVPNQTMPIPTLSHSLMAIFCSANLKDETAHFVSDIFATYICFRSISFHPFDQTKYTISD